MHEGRKSDGNTPEWFGQELYRDGSIHVKGAFLGSDFAKHQLCTPFLLLLAATCLLLKNMSRMGRIHVIARRPCEGSKGGTTNIEVEVCS